MNHKKNPSSKNRQNRGFAIAAGICLIAIGVAAWASYDSIVQEPADIDSQVSISELPSQEESTTSKLEPTPTPDQTVGGSVASSPTPSPTAAPTATPAPTQVDLSFPVGQKVLKRFSDGTPVFSDTMQDWRVHNGVDFEAASGESVKSMGTGTVTDVLEDSLLGHVVVITHGDVEAWYCGLGEKVLVEKGAKVEAGKEIGTVGECPSESAEAEHLHLEIKKDGEWIDPLSRLMKENS